MVKKYFSKILIPLGIALSWSAVILWRTGGLSAFTTYSYTIYRAGSLPRTAPDLPFVTMKGEKVHLGNYQGKYILIEFMYLHCTTVCGILRAKLYEYYPLLMKDKNIIQMSLSFDPFRDTPEILYSSWQSLGEKKNWIFGALVGGKKEITRNLEKFGVAAFQNNYTLDYNHTSLFFLISPDGKLVAFIDPSHPTEKNITAIQKIIRGSGK